MSLRNIIVQYVGDTLYLPPLEREVNHIIVRKGDERMDEKQLNEWPKFAKRCINCDAYGYKTANDWKYGRKYCFTHKIYINKPDMIVCDHWLPTD